jgi:RNA polymerase sigma factor (sigma-70 family)
MAKPLTNKLWDCYVLQMHQQKQAFKRKRLAAAGARSAWRRWHREEQIVRLLPIVERIARNVRWMFAEHLDFADLRQARAVGLVAAANSYDPSRGELEPYAYFRVRGAIIDSQKRRGVPRGTERIAARHRGGERGALPPWRDRADTAPLPDAIAEQEQIRQMLTEAVRDLPPVELAIIQSHLDGRAVERDRARHGALAAVGAR